MKVVRMAGAGRAFVLLREEGRYGDLVGPLFEFLAKRARVVEIALPRVTSRNWRELTAELREILKREGVRQLSILAGGAATTIAQNLLLEDLRAVRVVVLLDPTTRAHPSLIERWSDRIERRLPLGLPLRLRTQAFDGAPHLHRMRCPILLVTTAHASPFERVQAREMARGLPTAWEHELRKSDQGGELSTLVMEFQDTPAKCPQRV